MASHLESEKFVFALFAVLLIAGLSLSVQWLPAVTAILGTSLGAIVAVSAGFLGSHVWSQHVQANTEPPVAPEVTQEPVPPPPDEDLPRGSAQ